MALATGGVRVYIGNVRISATSGWRPFLASLVLGAIAVALAPRGVRQKTIAADLESLGRPFTRIIGTWRMAPVMAWVRRLAPWRPSFVAAFAAVAVIVTGLTEGSFVALASDPYGYVSQAHVWATLSFDVPEPMMQEMKDVAPAEAFAPLGWRPNIRQDGIVPTYSPGLPIAMGAFERFGGRNAVFFVIPLLGGIAVWATFLLGRSIWGSTTAVSGALLLATSPVFLVQLTGPPMSDLPCTAWWVLALALVVTFDSTAAMLAGGLAAGAAILTRPNLAPLALVPAALIVWPALRDRRVARHTIVRFIAFSAPVLAASTAVAAINAYWYGSPTTSGYGNVGVLFSWEYWSTNIVSYPSWLVEVHTPLIVLALATPFIVPTHPGVRSQFGPVAPVAMVCSFAVLLYLSYLFYMPFGQWVDLRFLLPALPVLLLGMSATILTIMRHSPSPLRGPIAGALIAFLVCHGLSLSRDRSAFTREPERQFALAGRYVREHLPERAVFLSMLHSGTVRLYSDRQTIRWDMLDPARLDQLLDRLRARGSEPYFVLDADELNDFRRHFKNAGRIGALDWAPIAELPARTVSIYAIGPTVGEVPVSAAAPTTITDTRFEIP